jgi:hypothetical protein
MADIIIPDTTSERLSPQSLPDFDQRCNLAISAVCKMGFLLESLAPSVHRLRAADQQRDAELIQAVLVRGRQLLGVATEMLDDDMGSIDEARKWLEFGSDLECYVIEGAEA